MKTLITIAGVFTLTVLFLCVNIGGKPIFEPIYSVLSHVTVPVQNATVSLLGSAFNSTQDYSRKLFHNSVPKVKDAVKSRASAPVRAGGEPSEVILVEEKEELDELIKSH